MPQITYRGQVEPDWIDANRHMNVASYDHVFDIAELRLFEEFGIDDASIRDTDLSVFRLERLVRYERELLLGEKLEVRSRIVWTDLRRVHHFHELHNLDRDVRAAFADAVSIHVDLRQRKSVPIDRPDVREPLERLAATHAAEPPPDGVLTRKAGRRIET